MPEVKEILEQKFSELDKKMSDKLKEVDGALKKAGETNAEYDEKLAKAQEEAVVLRQKMDALETAINRPEAVGLKAETEVNEAEFKKAFDLYMRKGDASSYGEIKSMNTASDPDGGYLVAPAVSKQIITRVFESSPIRQLASIETISTDSLEFPIDDEEIASGGWVGEQQSRSETSTPQVGLKTIAVHELYAEPRATQKLLDDAQMNIEQWLSNKVSDKFGRDEATAFVSGNGITKPRGFLTYTAWASAGVYERNKIEQINSGASGAFTGDGFIDLQNALKEPFQANAVFLIKRASFGAVRKLKDGDGQYLLGIGGDLTKGQQMTLLGAPVRFADDMPVAAPNSLSVAYGDFRAGYTIVDRVGIRVLRDPFTAKPFVKFYTTKRVGGDVTNFEAIKIQKLSS